MGVYQLSELEDEVTIRRIVVASRRIPLEVAVDIHIDQSLADRADLGSAINGEAGHKVATSQSVPRGEQLCWATRRLGLRISVEQIAGCVGDRLFDCQRKAIVG